MKARIRKRPTAKSKIKKVNNDILSSQVLSQEPVERRKSLPRSRKATKKTLVHGNQTLFTPKKDNEAPMLVREKEVDSGDDSGSDSDSGLTKKGTREPKISNTASQMLTTYETKLPKSTMSWKPLPPVVFAELKTVLHYLLPDSFAELHQSQQNVIQRHLLTPLFKRFAKLALPNLKPAELNLSTQETDYHLIGECYNNSVEQLEDVIHQSLLESKYLETEKKYLSQYKEKTSLWKQEKEHIIKSLQAKAKIPLDYVDISKVGNMPQPSELDPALESLLIKLDNKLTNILHHTANGNSLFKTLDRLHRQQT